MRNRGEIAKNSRVDSARRRHTASADRSRRAATRTFSERPVIVASDFERATVCWAAPPGRWRRPSAWCLCPSGVPTMANRAAGASARSGAFEASASPAVDSRVGRRQTVVLQRLERPWSTNLRPLTCPPDLSPDTRPHLPQRLRDRELARVPGADQGAPAAQVGDCGAARLVHDASDFHG